MENNHIEAWKAVTEFTKVIISLSATILTVLIGYITLHSNLFPRNFIPPAFFVLAIILSIFGFGRAIPAIKTGVQKPHSILFSNLAALALIIGIITIPAMSVNEKQTVNEILLNIQQETQFMNYRLTTNLCDKIYFNDDVYMFEYVLKDKVITVKYSEKSKQIIFIGELQNK